LLRRDHQFHLTSLDWHFDSAPELLSRTSCERRTNDNSLPFRATFFFTTHNQARSRNRTSNRKVAK
jgi:hypothetical protein